MTEDRVLGDGATCCDGEGSEFCEHKKKGSAKKAEAKETTKEKA